MKKDRKVNIELREEGVENVVIMLLCFIGMCGIMAICAIGQAIITWLAPFF